MSIDAEYFERLLEAKRDKLHALMQSSKDSTKPVKLDQTSVGQLSHMDAIQVQARAAEEHRRNELHRIDTTSKCMESGDYGYCVTCEEEIAPKRLEFDPTTLTCIRCASQGE